MIVSVVIPTYGRVVQLGATLDSVLASDMTGVERLEILVVDDGSPNPARPVVEARSATGKVSLSCVRQENAGPAAARNTGFRATSGVIVLFIDDDVLCPPGLVRGHIEAHRERPGSVIMGCYPYAPPVSVTPFYRYFKSLGYGEWEEAPASDYVESYFISSGNISVERTMFDDGRGVYRDDLRTPVAEEYELAYHLKSNGVPVFLSPKLGALHNRSVDLPGMSRQAFTHGRGCAEAARRCPGAPDLILALRTILDVNGPTRAGERPKAAMLKRLKGWLAPAFARSCLLRSVGALERLVPSDAILRPFYRFTLGLYFFAGVRDGLRRFPVTAMGEADVG